MAVSTSTHPYKIYVSTQPCNVFELNDRSLESPVMMFKCNARLSYVPDRPLDKSLRIRSSIQDHDSWHELEIPAKDLTRDFISDNMFSNTIIPFSLTNLHWKNKIFDKDSVPLTSIDGLVTLMLDASQSMISESRESGRKKLLMLVYVKKEVVVPQDEYLAKHKAKEAQKVLRQVEDMVRLQAQGWNFSESDWEAMTDAVRQAGLGNSVRSALNLSIRRATRESRRQVRLVPAAATSIEALEKVTRGDCSDKEEKCPVCMEEMLIGSQVTCMPCSHVFHSDCIVRWLNTSHMCPICRFKLPTS